MIIVADSGSTKTDWRVVSDSGELNIETRGINPFFESEDSIARLIRETFNGLANPPEVKQIHFYGAGCSDEAKCMLIQNPLTGLFPNAEINVAHDLLGAARATCGKEEGIACILGTGSNSCLFDGRKITDNITALGHLLGDEGSGSDLGRRLLTAYYYRELPQELADKFSKAYPLSKTDLLDTIYKQSPPNQYIAGFSTFISENLSHDFMTKLVTEAFSNYLTRHVCKYRNSRDLQVHFVGSIAYHFSGVLKECCSEKNLLTGKILKKPIDNLVACHFNK